MILQKIKAIIDIIIDKEEQTPETIQQNKRKGDMFERYIISLFTKNNRPNKTYFTVENWTRDINKNDTGVEVISNQYPDLIMCYNRKEYFAVECKWRKGFYYSQDREGAILKWSYYDQIKRYEEFQKDKKIPVFIVIGVAGDPNNPKKMYCLPLSKAKYPELFPSYLKDYERDPKKPFFWKNGDLL